MLVKKGGVNRGLLVIQGMKQGFAGQTGVKTSAGQVKGQNRGLLVKTGGETGDCWSKQGIRTGACKLVKQGSKLSIH